MGRFVRRTPEDREWARRAEIASDAALALMKTKDLNACYVCGRTRDQVKLWIFTTTGEDDELSRGRPMAIMACDEHDPNKS